MFWVVVYVFRRKIINSVPGFFFFLNRTLFGIFVLQKRMNGEATDDKQ